MFYIQFDKFISVFSTHDFPGDFWYDVARFEADEILKKFSDHDWKLLLNNFKKKNKFWKQRLLESIIETDKKTELNIIFNNILDSGDKDLILLTFDIIRDYDHMDKNLKEKIINFYKNNKIEGIIESIIMKEISKKL